MPSNYTAGEKLISYIKGYLVISIMTLIVVLMFQIDSAGLFSRKLCISTECMGIFFSSLQGAPELMTFLLETLVSFVTIYVVAHALIHYLNSVETSRSNVYLMHLNTFNTFLTSEIESYPRLDIKSFDVFKWYNLAFPEARDGKLKVV